jgi:hypothetical protein
MTPDKLRAFQQTELQRTETSAATLRRLNGPLLLIGHLERKCAEIRKAVDILKSAQ